MPVCDRIKAHNKESIELTTYRAEREGWLLFPFTFKFVIDVLHQNCVWLNWCQPDGL